MRPNEYVPTSAVHLYPSMFTDAERTIVSTNDAVVSTFRYDSGVEALRITTERVEVVVLPFRGQQVWRYIVDGEPLTMVTHFDEPAASTVFGETYGGFLLHCGLTGIGHPAPEDTHAHHGELPNGRFDEALLLVGDGPDGTWVGVAGSFRLRVSHGIDVEFEPFLALRPGGTALDLDVRITNHRDNPFGYSYLCHVNWPIFDGGRLAQTVRLDAEHFEMAPDPGQDDVTAAYTERITANLDASNELDIAQSITPEYCAILTPEADDDGWAHFLQVRPDGRAASVSFETEHLPHVIRWISNTGDESAAGFCLPSTAHHRGRVAAERDGMVRTIQGHESVDMSFEIDFLPKEETDRRLKLIEQVLATR
ncbi:DUF4432 family protein [Tessaracoccus sp. OS52]|uniref:DUF4432 family protein n=1 Tax=Tessaracoccus sp. OS52 TaxID=2886691 RepID=UPI001D110C2A|nr:DUF4432 family protein [Tessaracoccus sp. OS52]MCC2594279.1 DUF4432 family protein [Tessaracoccus sp. OS52]